MRDKLYDTDLSDAAWAIVAPLLPPARPGGRPRTTCLRSVLDAILYLLRTGCQGRLLPREYPPWGTVQIVCSQSPKGLALALRSGGDYVSNLDGAVGDDHAVDEQFQQLPFPVEACLLQARAHAAAERLGMGREASGFVLAIGVVHELAFLALKRLQPNLGLAAAALILGQ